MYLSFFIYSMICGHLAYKLPKEWHTSLVKDLSIAILQLETALSINKCKLKFQILE